MPQFSLSILLLTSNPRLIELHMLLGFCEKKKEGGEWRTLIELLMDLEENLHGIQERRKTFGGNYSPAKVPVRWLFFRKVNLRHHFLFSLIILPELSSIYWQEVSLKKCFLEYHILSDTLRLVRVTCLDSTHWIIWSDEKCRK